LIAAALGPRITLRLPSRRLLASRERRHEGQQQRRRAG
jgi:hypothetical protein